MGSMNLLETLMNKENMKNLFQNDPDIGPFLVHITMSPHTCTAEIAHIDIINLFAANNFDVEHMNEYLEKYKNTKCASDDFIDKILDIIIDDYNTKYFDHDYVHNPYAYMAEMIIN